MKQVDFHLMHMTFWDRSKKSSAPSSYSLCQNTLILFKGNEYLKLPEYRYVLKCQLIRHFSCNFETFYILTICLFQHCPFSPDKIKEITSLELLCSTYSKIIMIVGIWNCFLSQPQQQHSTTRYTTATLQLGWTRKWLCKPHQNTTHPTPPQKLNISLWEPQMNIYWTQLSMISNNEQSHNNDINNNNNIPTLEI